MNRTILSIDGGGIRGIIPAVVLAELEARTGEPIAELFDIVAGTSTGGILASGLTAPGENGEPAYAADDIVDIYEEQGERIFDSSVFHTITSFGGAVDQKYPSDGLRGVLKEMLGEPSLSEALAALVVPTYDLRDRDTWIWRREEAREKPHTDRKLWEVAFSTSVAPTYFEPYHFEDSKGHAYTLVDGGLYSNNPSLMGVTEALSRDDDLDELFVVSLGTGSHEETIPDETADDWGLAGWAKPAIECAMDGSSDAADTQCRWLLSDDQYVRLQTPLAEANESMDDPSPANLAALRTEANHLIEANASALDHVVEQLTTR